MADRQGVEIDYCPQCRGIWLDRGELDKIIERANNALFGQDRPPLHAGPAPTPSMPPRRNDDDDRPRYRDNDDRYRDDDDYRKRKKKSIFNDLFDF